MVYFRVIAIEGGDKTIQLEMPFECAPSEGDVFTLPDGVEVRVRHVIRAARDGLDGVLFAWVQ